MSEVFKPGDIIGFTGSNHVSDIINLATFGIPRWSTSHIGILGEYEGELLLFESTTLTNMPCVIKRHQFKGTQAHRLKDRVATYHGKCWHYAITRPLYDDERERMNKFLLDHIGIPYDEIGAFRAGDPISWIEALLHEQNLSSIFCSEWLAATHNEVGLFSTSNVSKWSPNRFVRYERKDGILMPRKRIQLIDGQLAVN